MQTFGERCSIRFSDCCFPSLAWWGGVGAAALDSNTISSVICCSCQWLFGGNCGNLFHYFSLSIVPLPLRLLTLTSLLHTKPARESSAAICIRKFINKSARWIYHCMIHVLCAAAWWIRSARSRNSLSLSWMPLFEFQLRKEDFPGTLKAQEEMLRKNRLSCLALFELLECKKKRSWKWICKDERQVSRMFTSRLSSKRAEILELPFHWN